MKRFFPIMYEDTDKGMHFALFAYWIFAFWLMPFWMPILAQGLWNKLGVISWFEMVYHAINGVVIALILKGYLQESFFNVQTDVKKFFKIVVGSALVMLALAFVAGLYFGGVIFDFYPLCEMSVAFTPGYLVQNQPIFGTICCSVFSPFAIVGLFYAAGFAPVCRRHRWLGYVVVAVVMALPCAFDILWRGEAVFVILSYLVQLPLHWVACWTYQNADTVWAPIATLFLFNFGTSLMTLM